MLGEQMYEAVQKIDAAKIERGLDDDPDSFDPAAIERQPEM